MVAYCSLVFIISWSMHMFGFMTKWMRYKSDFLINDDINVTYCCMAKIFTGLDTQDKNALRVLSVQGTV